MNEVINEKVSVIVSYNRDSGKVTPRRMRWQGKDYNFTKLAYSHQRKKGRLVLHVFDVTDGAIDFRLVCNSNNLHWVLEEVADGNH